MRLRRKLKAWIEGAFQPFDPTSCERCGCLFDATFIPKDMPAPSTTVCSLCLDHENRAEAETEQEIANLAEQAGEALDEAMAEAVGGSSKKDAIERALSYGRLVMFVEQEALRDEVEATMKEAGFSYEISEPPTAHRALEFAARLAQKEGWDFEKFQDEGAGYYLAWKEKQEPEVPEVPEGTFAP